MEIIDIFPVKNIYFEKNQRMHMFLTHLVEKDETYVEAAKSSEGYKILDNSLIEIGEALTMERLLKAAEIIGADEIILPDVFRDGKATIASTTKAIKELKEIYPNGCPYKVMAVAHGKDINDWIECYNFLLNNPDVDVIGIPKVCAKMHPQGRAYFVNNICKPERKSHHLLGLWYSIKEFELINRDKLRAVRSCDTCHMSFCTLYNLPFDSVRPDGWTVDLEEDEIKDDAKLFENINKTIKYISNLCPKKTEYPEADTSWYKEFAFDAWAPNSF